jgi:hypothetical protein
MEIVFLERSPPLACAVWVYGFFKRVAVICLCYKDSIMWTQSLISKAYMTQSAYLTHWAHTSHVAHEYLLFKWKWPLLTHSVSAVDIFLKHHVHAKGLRLLYRVAIRQLYLSFLLNRLSLILFFTYLGYSQVENFHPNSSQLIWTDFNICS